MKLLINDQEIDFSLEQEKNLQDIITQINQWSVKEGLSIQSIQSDGRTIDPSDIESWKNISVDNIHSLSIRAAAAGVQEIENISVVLDFFEIAVELINTKRDEGYKNLIQEESVIRHLLKSILSPDEIKSLVPEFPENIAQITDKFKTALGKLVIVLRSRIKEWNDPLTEFKATLTVLSQMFDSIRDIGLNFQIGKNQSAISTIMALTEILAKTARLSLILRLTVMNKTENNSKLADDQRKINEFLNVFSQAMTNQDIVTMSDVMEYELLPFLEDLTAYWLKQ